MGLNAPSTLQIYNNLLNHQIKNRKKSLIDEKTWETIQKAIQMHHKEAKVMYL